MIEFVRELSEMETSVAHYEPSEADLRERLIRPVLTEWLAFPKACINAEHTLRGQRPDYVCRVDLSSRTVALFVEVKALGVDLRSRPPGGRISHIPIVQLSDYLVRRPDAHTNSWGILTNGREWILQKRDGPDAREVGSCRVDNNVTDLRKFLEPITHSALSQAPEDARPFEDAWLSLLQTAPVNARNLLEKLGDAVSLNHVTPDEQVIPGMDVARAWVLEKSNKTDIAAATRLIVAVSQSRDGRITMSDVRSLLDRGADGCADALVLAGPAENNRDIAVARLAVRVDGKLRTTLEFDPTLPSPAVRTAIKRMHDAFKPRVANRKAKLDEALNPRHLEREFFEEAGNWFASVASGKAGKEELLLLIQLLFVWLLRERGWIPEELFLEPQIEDPLFSFHERLMTLCTEVMSTPLEKRSIRGTLWDKVPFLNGSLFRKRKNQPAKLTNNDYFETGDEQPGIITILKRYQWTLSEQGSRHSELAMDPSLLGALFEQLVVKAEGIIPSVEKKMPSGTYYTPMDLVDEMVCDALSEAVMSRIKGITGSDIGALLHPEHVDGIDSNRWRETALYGNQTLYEKVGAVLKQLTVIDPCTGSGAFIVGVLNALRRAARRLEGESYNDTKRVRDAVEKQLFAIDKMPIAVQIARLRLFIAIVDGLDPKHGNPPPLPNLEVRITSADMLATSVSKTQVGLFESDDAFKATIDQFTKNRQNYVSSDNPEDKEQRIDEDNKLRGKLREQLKQHSGLVTDLEAFLSWLDAGILENDEQTADLDPKLLFQQPQGWDVVIGNPPYQKPTKNEKKLVKARDYETTDANDLYTLCTEVAFALAKETTGNVTFIVPNSITFAAAKKCLRDLIHNKAQRLLVRTYDNRPKPVFPPHPFIKGGDRGAENRQRVSIITARMGNKQLIERHCTGYIRLATATRSEQLRWRPQNVVGVDMNGTWAHVPTQELADLLKAMSGNATTQTQNTETSVLTFPVTCFRFISCVPEDMLKNDSRREYIVPKDREMAWVSLYNSHLFYAYWLMTGDAFHLLHDDICSIQEPPGWNIPEILDKAIEAGSALAKPQVIRACRKDFKQGGKIFPNVDFHSIRPDLIEECDRINLRAYGFEDDEFDTLLKQMKILRTGSLDQIP